MAATEGRCRWVRRRLPLLAGGELVGTERRRVERHLIGCPACVARRDATVQSLTFLRGAGSARPDCGDRGAAPSLWPNLDRQIREARHGSGRRSTWAAVRPRLPRLVAALAGSGLAASLALTMAWRWSAPVVLPTRPADHPEPLAAAKPSLPPPTARGDVRGFDPSWSFPWDLEIPLAGVEPRAGAVPRPSPAVDPASPRPGADPFEPPLPLRLDYDLDRGTLSVQNRDTQRAY